MKQRWISWILGTFLSVSLVAAPATAANKGGKARIPAAKRYRVTQITERDVMVQRGWRVRAARLIFLQDAENGRGQVAPNPDVQRGQVAPNPDVQRGQVAPNPDVQRGQVAPNPDAQRGQVAPNPSVE